MCPFYAIAHVVCRWSEKSSLALGKQKYSRWLGEFEVKFREVIYFSVVTNAEGQLPLRSGYLNTAFDTARYHSESFPN